LKLIKRKKEFRELLKIIMKNKDNGKKMMMMKIDKEKRKFRKKLID
jgi:hypothetical protein